MSYRKKLLSLPLVALFFLSCLTGRDAQAGLFELSLAGSYSHSNYANASFNWNRKWGASFGYHLSEHSEIEFSFQDVTDRTLIAGYEDTTIHDRIYGVNWVQALMGKGDPIQPYVKVGIGQLNRDASGSYAFGIFPPSELDSVTGILGAGLKIYLTRSFAIRGEITTYLVGGAISTYKDNFATTIGFSAYF